MILHHYYAMRIIAFSGHCKGEELALARRVSRTKEMPSNDCTDIMHWLNCRQV